MIEVAKFNKNMANIPYIIGVDLALYRTGVCVYHPKENAYTDLSEVVVAHNDEAPILSLYYNLETYLNDIVRKYGPGGMVIQEAMPLQAGPHSTISTLQTLAKAHSVLELLVCQSSDLYRYDDTGVYSISVKALFKTEEIQKPTKQDIRAALKNIYNIKEDVTENTSDAMAVVHTLINKKWNADIKNKLAEIRKEIKKLKSPKAIEEHQKLLQEMEVLKI